MANILSFSAIELACAFCALADCAVGVACAFWAGYGRGVGCGSCAGLETLPKEGRGAFSGILQEGLRDGIDLASAAVRSLLPLDWRRGLFMLARAGFVGLLCASTGQESPVWLEGARKRLAQAAGVGRPALSGNCWRFCLRFSSWCC